MQRGKGAQPFSILLQTTGKALIGEVKQRQPALLNGELRQGLPLIQSRIDAGWVVAAAVEQHHVTRLGVVEACQQAVKVQRMVSRVIVSIFAHLQPGCIKHAFMVRPAWVAHPDAHNVGVFRQEVCRHAQRASAARGLRRTGALVVNDRIAFAKQQLLGATAKFRDPVNAEIVLRRLVLQQILLGFLHAGQHRRFTGFIFIDADAKVNFCRTLVGTKQIG